MEMRDAVLTRVLRCVVLLVVAVSVCVGVASSAWARPRVAHRSYRCAQVYWRTSRDHDQRCPSSHSVIADISYTNLHWTNWTATRADGQGEELGFDDAPGPRAASIVQALAIKLTRARQCPDGRWIYTRISVTIYAAELTIPLGARIPRMPAKGRIASRFHKVLSCNPTGGIG